ncbi:MAG: methyltransferase domain-containing protein [Candidatus Caldarchaeum sp.]
MSLRLCPGCWLRRLVQNPYRLLETLGVAEGHVFLDVGCGKGFVSIAAAEMVGDKGCVYAVDVEQKYLEEVGRRAEALGLKNVKTLLTPAEALDGVVDESVDRAVMMLSLHHFVDVRKAFIQLRNKLKPSGRAMMVDPISSRLLGHGTNPSKVINLMEETGLKPYNLRKGLLLWSAAVKPV